MPSDNFQKRPRWAQSGLEWIGRLGNPLPLSVLVTGGIVLGVRAIGALEGLELALYDRMVRLRPPLPPDERVLVVGIDETDVQTRGEWPISDSTLAELLDIVLAAEPRAVGLDIFRDVPIGDGQDRLLETAREDSRIVTVCKLNSRDTPGVPPPAGVPDLQIGFSDFVIDSGGVLRRNLLFSQPLQAGNRSIQHLCNTPDAQLTSLSLQLALIYLEAEGIFPEVTPEQEIKLGDAVLSRLTANAGGYHNVDAEGYQILLDFRAPRDAFPEVSLSQVLSGQVSPEQIRDRIVLIGVTTPEANDNFYTPYSGEQRDDQQMPGVIIHAQSASQLLGIALDGQPLLWSWTNLAEGLWVMGWAVGGAVFARSVKRPVKFSVGTVLLLGGLYGVCYGFFLQGGWIPIVPPALAVMLAAGGVVLLERFNESDYGQAVYQQVKTLLRLNIEVDETRVEQQVSEITETDYFATLQQRARQLRSQQQPQAGPAPEAQDGDLRSPQPSETTDDLDRQLKDLKNMRLQKDVNEKSPPASPDGEATGGPKHSEP